MNPATMWYTATQDEQITVTSGPYRDYDDAEQDDSGNAVSVWTIMQAEQNGVVNYSDEMQRYEE